MERMVGVGFQGVIVTLREAVDLAKAGTQAAHQSRLTRSARGKDMHDAKKVIGAQIGIDLDPLINASARL